MVQVNDKWPSDVPEGIWLEYMPHQWIIVIKDPAWTVEELRKGRKAHMILYFVQKGIVDAFLLEIEDCMECSDIPFCMKDASEEMKQSIQEEGDEKLQVLLTDADDTVKAARTFDLSKEHGVLLKNALRKRLEEAYTAADFDAAYAEILEKYEPFELEPDALFTVRL